MSLRNLRPAAGKSSASISNPSPSRSESTAPRPRRNRDDKDCGGDGSSTPKRRRVPESVTRNACLNCKEARAKCDGTKPCKRCATRLETASCIYEVHIKHAKEELVKQIKEFKAKDHLTERILTALSEEQDKVPEIVERLQNGEAYETIAEWLRHSVNEDRETLSPRTSHHPTLTASDHEMEGTSISALWSSVKCDQGVFDHLFQLYFTWVHPVHTIFDEGQFSDCMKHQLPDYCSESLVNAICAMACHLRDADGVETYDTDFEQLGEAFSDAALANLNPKDYTVTNIQTFAVMFLVDCARSKGLRAASYLREATSSLSSLILKSFKGWQGLSRFG